MRPDNKIAIVAGIGGLGRVTALGLVDAGADLVVADINLGVAEEAAEKIKAMGKRAYATTLDISKPEQSQKLVEFAMEKFGKFDILVNTVGLTVKKPSTEITEADWDRILDTNLRGPSSAPRRRPSS